ncbi:M48 family metallopeptidase [Paraburkholderia sp.]|uniref:M48 family metallopeptidase n=1 Tax=Paraburkholderia sp. TaxID=1926495 RepID=UPI002382E635|nr:M48 family metallopeptidase [Paraburkholderia sp.]MDE1181420.1 M48 family metallopeptidase [Paraburkholderia sp.]
MYRTRVARHAAVIAHRSVEGAAVKLQTVLTLTGVSLAFAAFDTWGAAATSAPVSSSAATPVTTSGSAATPNATSAANPNVGSGASAPGGSNAGSAPAFTNPPSYSQNNPFHFGNYTVFRNLIPSPLMEAQSYDEFAEIKRGAEHQDRLFPASDARVQRVREITDKLIPYSLKWNDRTKVWKWDIAVIRSSDIRMYCLPGGKIVVYSGLLDRVKLNDNELGMLLGHEIAHALREHARERLGEQQVAAQPGSLSSPGAIPQLFGLADLGAPVLGIGSQLLEMKYEGTDETEADVIGSDIASRAGYDPRAAITLWDKLAATTRADRDRGYIYVHPYSPARRQDIMKRLPDMLPLYAKALGRSVDSLPDYAGIGRPRRKSALGN